MPTVQLEDACQFTPPSGPTVVVSLCSELPGSTYCEDDFPLNVCRPNVMDVGMKARPAGLFAAASASSGRAIDAPPIEALAAPWPPGCAPFTAQTDVPSDSNAAAQAARATN